MIENFFEKNKYNDMIFMGKADSVKEECKEKDVEDNLKKSKPEQDKMKWWKSLLTKLCFCWCSCGKDGSAIVWGCNNTLNTDCDLDDLELDSDSVSVSCC